MSVACGVIRGNRDGGGIYRTRAISPLKHLLLHNDTARHYHADTAPSSSRMFPAPPSAGCRWSVIMSCARAGPRDVKKKGERGGEESRPRHQRSAWAAPCAARRHGTPQRSRARVAAFAAAASSELGDSSGRRDAHAAARSRLAGAAAWCEAVRSFRPPRAGQPGAPRRGARGPWRRQSGARGAVAGLAPHRRQRPEARGPPPPSPAPHQTFR